VQEAVELLLTDWLALTTRLRNGVLPYQQLIADCNPDAPTHWLWVRAQSGQTTMRHSRHEDNPRLFRGDVLTEEGRIYIERLDRLGHLNPDTGQVEGTEYQRLRQGLWVQATGLIFDVWSDGPEGGNVTEAAEYIPDGGAVLWGVDDGYTGSRDAASHQWTADSHPRVFGLYQLRRDGTICRFAESYAAGLLSDAHLAQVLAMPYPRPDYAVVDKSAAELKGRLHAEGIYTRNGPADVEESIKELRRALAADGNGRRRVLVHPRCRDLRAEMASYRRDANGRIIKAWDHGIDEMRYLVYALRHEV
jgi:phage terminase large subunit